MNFEQSCDEELASISAKGLRRTLPPLPSNRIDFCSNDYLGLARDPRLIAAAREAAARHGVGGRAARLLGGGSDEMRALEREVAQWLGAEDALLATSGYQANLALVTALVGRGDLLLSDIRNHASLIDGARLSRATVRIYRDPEELEHWLREGRGARRRLVLTEGIFSMDGDAPDLRRLAELCLEYGARLVVDEAHAAGLVGAPDGPRVGAGAWAAVDGPPAALAARIVTGGKALGAGGALIVGSNRVRELCLQRGRAIFFSTAPPPPVVAALRAGVAAARCAHAERRRCLEGARALARGLGLPAPAAAIVPIPVGDAEPALLAARELATQGLDLGAVRPPTVPEGSSRLRAVVHAGNGPREIERLQEALGSLDLPRDTSRKPRTPKGRVIVVVGTDTGIGKTVVAAALALRLGARYWKPVQTGDDDDTSTVQALAGVECIPPLYRFDLPASPHEAARAAGKRIEIDRLDERLGRLRRNPGVSVVELAGGLHVPLTDTFLQADWLARHRPEILLVARSTLGTLNHTLLTLEALAARGLRPSRLVLVGPAHPSNRATLAARGDLPLVEMPLFDPLTPAALAAWAQEAL